MLPRFGLSNLNGTRAARVARALTLNADVRLMRF